MALAAGTSACTSDPAPVGHFADRYGALNPIVLDNLTLSGGRYDITLDLEIFIRVPGPPVTVSCVIIDTTGVLGPLFGTGFHATGGGWYSITSTSTHDLPETTLGLRCYPNTPAVLEVLVRSADLRADRIS